MYNGIGLQTPRGSGTNGYMQKNLSHINSSFKQQLKNRDDFLKELKALRENVKPAQKKANDEIVTHQLKRDIYLQLEEMKEKLEEKGLTQGEIELKLKKAEKILLEKYENGEFNSSNQVDTHQQAIAKEKEQEKLREAFNIKGDYNAGSAFDFDEQEKKRLQKLYDRELEKQEQYQKLKDQKKLEKIQQKEKEKQEKQLLLEEQNNILKAEKNKNSQKDKKHLNKNKDTRYRSSSSKNMSENDEKQQKKNHHSDKQKHAKIQKKFKSESKSKSNSRSRSRSNHKKSKHHKKN